MLYQKNKITENEKVEGQIRNQIRILKQHIPETYPKPCAEAFDNKQAQ